MTVLVIEEEIVEDMVDLEDIKEERNAYIAKESSTVIYYTFVSHSGVAGI